MNILCMNQMGWLGAAVANSITCVPLAPSIYPSAEESQCGNISGGSYGVALDASGNTASASPRRRRLLNATTPLFTVWGGVGQASDHIGVPSGIRAHQGIAYTDMAWLV
jgi:hypothetical protein